MKACVLTSYNTPWSVVDKPIPEPLENQVLIKIHACGLCGTDLHVTHGLFPTNLPLTPGHEPVGEIIKIGKNVSGLNIGDRVGVSWHQKGCGSCSYCLQKRDLYCIGRTQGAYTWMDLGGGMAEYMVAYADGCTKIPDGLSYELAAPLFCAGFTVSSGYQNANPKKEDVVAILGLGGLGHIALQLAKAKGHKTIVLSAHDDKKQLSRELGADEVLTGQNLGIQLKNIGGADIILDCSSSNLAAQETLIGLKPEGRLVLMGIDSVPFEVQNHLLIHLQAKIIGSTQNHRSDLVDILNLAAAGKIKPLVEVFGLEDCNKALERLEKQDLRFRAVFKIIS